MLLTIVTFMIGAPMERFVCQTITDTSLTQLEKVSKVCLELIFLLPLF